MMETKQESKAFKAVTMNLILATRDDLYKFKKIGFMYFVYYHNKQAFEAYPKFTYKGMDVVEFYDFMNLEMIYIPQGLLDNHYLERTYYEKTTI